MTLDWEPSAELAERAKARGLHLGRFLENFRQYWIDEKVRKTRGNWNKTFAANISRTCNKPHLFEQYRLTEAERARASWPTLEAPTTEREVTDAEADAVLAEALRGLDEHTNPRLLREVQADDAPIGLDETQALLATTKAVAR